MIDFEAIFKSMDYFGFGTKVIGWTKTLYTGFTATVQNNGFFSNKIKIEHSVHQGGPCSTYYFLICAEILAIQLRGNENIKEIVVDQVEYLLGQYADNMDTYLQDNPEVVGETISTLEWFRWNAGFTVNYDKTIIYRIGSLKQSQASRYVSKSQEKNIKITTEPINVLGVWIARGNHELLALNHEPLIRKVSDTLNQWKNRDLSLLGKIRIINTLCALLFVYKMQVLPHIPDYIIRTIERQFVQYLWRGGVPKIAIKILQGNKEDGGMGLVNLANRDLALKINWVPYLEVDVSVANLAYNAIGCMYS